MKVRITHLKAPWPAGAGVGDVVEVPGAELPGSLVGKCSPVGDDEEGAEAVAVFAPEPPPQPAHVPEVLAVAGGAEDDAKAAAALLEAAKDEADELRQRLEAAAVRVAELEAQVGEQSKALEAAAVRVAELEAAAAAKPKK